MLDREIERAGRLLAEARRTGRVLSRADCDLSRIGSLAEAEAVNDEATALLGPDRIGLNLAATTPEIARRFGSPGPIAGALLPEDRRSTGSELRVARGMLGIGAQFLFVFGRSYPEDDESIGFGSIGEAIASCHVGLQVLGRRTAPDLPLDEWVGTADFGLVECIVEGTRVERWRERDLRVTPVLLSVDGHLASAAKGASTFGSPLAPPVWLARRFRARGRQIGAGEIVAAGSCTTLLQLTPGRTVRASFGELGSAELRLV
jgi:2-keto-4-pentenoate hydratase